MAHSDYTARGLGLPFCPTARLSAAIGALDTTVTMTGYVSPVADGIRIGMAAMIDDEIVVIEARAGNALTLGRGCCDTVPAAHASNTTIFFFDDSVGTDGVQYTASESIGVKPLPKTNSGGPVPIESSPPEGLTFNWRFHRPYPPGLVLVNGSPFTTTATLSSSVPNLVVTWAHRDRIVQMDQLVKHGEPSVGPEPGTNYRVRVYRTSDNALLRTADLGAVATWTYTFAQMVADFGPSFVDIPGYVTLESRRDSLSSWQFYRINFVAAASLAASSAVLNVGYEVGSVTPDAFFSQVLLLLMGEGANGSTTFTDSSSYARGVSIGAGTPAISTAHARIGSASIYGGSGSPELLFFRGGSEWNRDNWTWETFYRRAADGNYHGLMYHNSNLFIRLRGPTDGGTYQLRIVLNSIPLLTSTSSVPLNSWTHLAVSVAKSGPTYTVRLFIDGILEASATSTNANLSLMSNASNMSIGRHDQAGFAGLNGYVDAYRITGDCRYTGDFEVPVFAGNYAP